MRVATLARMAFPSGDLRRQASGLVWYAVLAAGMACTGKVADPPGGTTASDGTRSGVGNLDTLPADDRPRVDPGQPLACNGVLADPGETIVGRLTRWEYVNTIRDTFRVDVEAVAEGLPYEIRAPLSTTSVAQSVDFKHAETFANVARTVVESMGDFVSDYSNCTDFSESCKRELVESLGAKTFRAPLRDDEITGFLPLFDVVQEEGEGFEVAAGLVLRAMLQSPQFLYQLEDERGDGVRRVGTYELANRLSYLVWQSNPDPILMTAAAAGELDTPAQIEAQVRRMVQDPRTQEASLTLFEDWVDLTRLERAVSGIDNSVKADMREETERFVTHILWDQERGLKDLLTAEVTFASPDLADLYGLADLGSGFRQYDLTSTATRRGLLTQASILASTANGNRPSIVSRGLFMLRSFLCRDVPDPPATVDTTTTDLADTASEREKSVERLERGACGACHRTFDPLAYGLESYDGRGRHQTQDDNGNPTRSDGWIPAVFGEFPEGDPRGQSIAYQDLDGLVTALAEHVAVNECLTEQPLTFALRRAVDAAILPDACAIQEVVTASDAAGGSYEALLVSIATHPMFSAVRAR